MTSKQIEETVRLTREKESYQRALNTILKECSPKVTIKYFSSLLHEFGHAIICINEEDNKELVTIVKDFINKKLSLIDRELVNL